LPNIVGISVYLVTRKLFPEKVKSFDKDPVVAVRGGDTKTKMLIRIFRKLIKCRTLKIALFATFNIAGITFFSDEIVALLTDDIFNSIRFIDTDGNLKILCDIVEEYEIKSHITKIK
jgi:hypothetical protein